MTLYLLRDDDVNATTDPDRFERAYEPLLSQGFPVCCSVIPEVALDTRAPDGVRERFVRTGCPISEACVPLRYDGEVARWLRAREGQLEVLQHGLSHRRLAAGTEFGGLAYAEAAERMERGRAVLEEALARPVEGFVAPWDILSAGSLRAGLERYAVLSTSWVSPGKLPVSWWPSHLRERARKTELLRHDEGLLLRHRGGKLEPGLDPRRVPEVLAELSRGAEVCVVVLHHWMFWEREEPHAVLRALAEALRGQTVVGARELLEREHRARAA